jgi:hypothetical protein
MNVVIKVNNKYNLLLTFTWQYTGMDKGTTLDSLLLATNNETLNPWLSKPFILL